MGSPVDPSGAPALGALGRRGCCPGSLALGDRSPVRSGSGKDPIPVPPLGLAGAAEPGSRYAVHQKNDLMSNLVELQEGPPLCFGQARQHTAVPQNGVAVIARPQEDLVGDGRNGTRAQQLRRKAPISRRGGTPMFWVPIRGPA